MEAVSEESQARQFSRVSACLRPHIAGIGHRELVKWTQDKQGHKVDEWNSLKACDTPQGRRIAAFPTSRGRHCTVILTVWLSLQTEVASCVTAPKVNRFLLSGEIWKGRNPNLVILQTKTFLKNIHFPIEQNILFHFSSLWFLFLSSVNFSF